MMYRAKCTWILNEIKTIYHGMDLNFVRDVTDIYAEVHSEFEAELIEAANRNAIERHDNLTRLIDVTRPSFEKPDTCYLVVDGEGWVSEYIQTNKEDAKSKAKRLAQNEDWGKAGHIKVVELDLNIMKAQDIEYYATKQVEE